MVFYNDNGNTDGVNSDSDSSISSETSPCQSSRHSPDLKKRLSWSSDIIHVEKKNDFAVEGKEKREVR